MENHSTLSGWGRRTAALPLLGVLFLVGCEQPVAIAPQQPRPVKVAVVTTPAATQTMLLSGAVKARVESTLGFRVAGKIIERKVDVGQRVVAGDVVARIDMIDLQLMLRSAEAGVESAKARVQVAKDAYERNRTLFERGHIAKAALDKTELEIDQAKAAFDQAVANRNQMANQTGYAALVADTAGIVTDVRADVGQVVSAGSPVVVIARDGEKEVAVAVPEQQIRHVSKGMKVDVSYWAEPGRVSSAEVREIAGSADAASRTFAVRVSLGEDPLIRLGQTATVSIGVPLDRTAPSVPLTALAKRDGRPIVWIVDRANETVSARFVEPGAPVVDGVRIEKGIVPGEVVVVAGTQFLTDGLKVKLPKADLAATTATGTTVQ